MGVFPPHFKEQEASSLRVVFCQNPSHSSLTESEPCSVCGFRSLLVIEILSISDSERKQFLIVYCSPYLNFR